MFAATSPLQITQLVLRYADKKHEIQSPVMAGPSCMTEHFFFLMRKQETQ